MQTTIQFSDGIYLPMPNSLPSHLKSEICNELTIINPAYIEATKFQRSTKTIPKNIKLFHETDEQIRLPRGYLFVLLKKLKREKLDYHFEDQTIVVDESYSTPNCTLRSYQQEAIEKALKYRQGIIISPCGSGKTVMGICFLALTGQRTLWVTHTKDLMYQTIDQIERFLAIPAKSIGKIGDGKKLIGEKVTVGIVQSLVKYDKEIIRNGFGTIIIDEAHRVPSKTFQNIVELSNAKYRVGLTATPKRKDGLDPILFSVVGPSIYQITEENLLAEQRILIPDVKKIYTNFTSLETAYLTLMNQLVTNEERNDLIVKTIHKTLKNTEVALVLSSRVQHCSSLAELIKVHSPRLQVAVLTGKISKAEREKIISEARNATLNVIIATQVADEGLDIPNLNKLYLATPSRSKAKIKQQVGRIMRNIDSKSTPVVYDFIDVNVTTLRRHGNIRTSVYHELGCHIF